MLALLLTLRTLTLLTSFAFLAGQAVTTLLEPLAPINQDQGQDEKRDQKQDDAPPEGGGSGGSGGGGIEVNPIVTEPPPVFHSAEELLDALEKSIATLENFSANVNYRKEDPFTSTEIRSGRIIFAQELPAAEETPAEGDDQPTTQPTTQPAKDAAHSGGPAARRFAITFERETIGRQMRERNQRYVFDGAWLAEIDFDNKQFIKRQVVPPGQTFDPLKLGEGPFPLPIGQSRKEVLARFEAELTDFPREGFLQGRIPPSGIGLKLTPRPGLEVARDFESIRIWYDRRNLLPIAVDALAPDGVRKIVLLFNIEKNGEIDESLLTVDPQLSEADGWAIDIRPWKESR